jgi:hypothetical protein
MTRIKLLVLLALLWNGFSYAQQQGGGMWIPTELNEAEMTAMGMKIGAKDIFKPDGSGINGAIAHFGGGCTSEVISSQGLLLTNHHCGYGQIQSHSSLENDYLKNGFWANNQAQELPNKGLTATFIINITDVTSKILAGITANTTPEQRMELIKANIEKETAATPKEDFQNVMIRSFYKGNKYYLFLTETFKDVRLVGAPPSSIGNFGMDTDNWSWPRHTGDFALFRIYADQNNKPAEYSESNVPYTPKHFLPISIKGVKEGDFTFVYGFPGATDEYLPAIALEQSVQSINPARVGIRDVAIKILSEKMKADDATRIKYASKYARISNAWKKWRGESLGLQKSGAADLRKKYEEDFINRLKNNSEHLEKYSHVLPVLYKLYEGLEKYQVAEIYFDEVIFRNSETFRMAIQLSNLLNTYGSEKFAENKNRIANALTNLYKDYDPDLDQEVSLALMDLYKKSLPAEFLPDEAIKMDASTFQNSILTGKRKVNGLSLIENTKEIFENEVELIKALEEDPLVKEITKIQDAYEQKVEPTLLASNEQFQELLRIYMEAQLAVFPDKKIFPDANSTLRVTYGKVNGYQPSDRPTRYEHQTYLDGVIAKYIPGDYEFDLPQKLIELQKNKDYGVYGIGKNKKAQMPVNFIASNHTTGGNSGSPALDKDGNLIGLNFDRVWEGTMSDLHYDSEICRNIMVDARYILFIIDKFAGAGYLLDEMKIIK